MCPSRGLGYSRVCDLAVWQLQIQRHRCPIKGQAQTLCCHLETGRCTVKDSVESSICLASYSQHSKQLFPSNCDITGVFFKSLCYNKGALWTYFCLYILKVVCLLISSLCRSTEMNLALKICVVPCHGHFYDSRFPFFFFSQESMLT